MGRTGPNSHPPACAPTRDRAGCTRPRPRALRGCGTSCGCKTKTRAAAGIGAAAWPPCPSRPRRWPGKRSIPGAPAAASRRGSRSGRSSGSGASLRSSSSPSSCTSSSRPASRGSFSAPRPTRPSTSRSSRGLPARRPFRRRDDAPLDAHGLPQGLLWQRQAPRAYPRLRPRLLRLDLPLRHAPPLLRVAPPVPLRPRRESRRGEQDARVPAREVLPPLHAFLVAGGRREARSAVSSIRSASRSAPSGSASSPRSSTSPGAAWARFRTFTPARSSRSPTTRRTTSRRTPVWRSRQVYFHQTWLIVFLLVAVLFANRFIPRFWCRVLLPARGVSRRLRPVRPVPGWRKRITPSAPTATCAS